MKNLLITTIAAVVLVGCEEKDYAMKLCLDNTYIHLPKAFYTKLSPVPVR